MTTRPCRLFHVDAFTRTRFGGNPAGVVLDADSLTDEQMQLIARELNGGETAFVINSEGHDHDLQVRFFSPHREVPFIGHATVAAQYVRAKRDGRPNGKLRQLTRAGIVEIEINEVDGDLRVSITQSPPSLGPVLAEQHRKQVLNALGISSPSLHVDCPLQIVVKGSPRLLIGLRSPDLLESVKPDFEELTRLTPHVGAEGFFVFALTENEGKPATLARMFCPAIGIPEDPASGNAHGMLGVYLVTHGLLKPDNSMVKFRGSQGQWLNRPSIIDVEVDCSGRVAQSVRISGDAVIVYEAELPM
jgi:PhzF family phenazine biosynthesis protein